MCAMTHSCVPWLVDASIRLCDDALDHDALAHWCVPWLINECRSWVPWLVRHSFMSNLLFGTPSWVTCCSAHIHGTHSFIHSFIHSLGSCWALTHSTRSWVPCSALIHTWRVVGHSFVSVLFGTHSQHSFMSALTCSCVLWVPNKALTNECCEWVPNKCPWVPWLVRVCYDSFMTRRINIMLLYHVALFLRGANSFERVPCGSLECVPWLIHVPWLVCVYRDSFTTQQIMFLVADSFEYVPCLIYVCPRLSVCSWLIHVCHDSFMTREIRLLFVCEGQTKCVRVSWLIRECSVTRSYVY